MRIVQIIPGVAGSFYCENCLRDTSLITALQKLGHDVLMVPMYLPVQAGGDTSINSTGVFFGGINVYLQQKYSFFRKTPRWFDRLFDSRKLLRWLGSKARMTSAKALGEMTVSMLRAEEGRQVKELNRLVGWLALQENRPDVVCLSNVLLAGLARRIKEVLNVPVLCLLQDEDGFLDGLGSPYAEQAWKILAERLSDVDAYIAVSKYYAGIMQQRLKFKEGQIHILYPGILLDGYESLPGWPELPAIGYLSRMCFDRGLDTLVEAFIMLKGNDKLRNLKLRIAGGRTSNDGVFIRCLRQKLEGLGFINDVEFWPDFDRDAKLGFFQTLSLLSVPEKHPVAYGLYVIESLAAGVPVVAPRSGAFPELLEMTGGGVLFEPSNVNDLAVAMERLLLEPDYARRLGEKGQKAVFEEFDVEKTAEQIIRICKEIMR